MSAATPAYACGVCAASKPEWRILRRGDAAVSWACDAHLAQECIAMQRDWEVSELVITLAQKTREWAHIGAALEKARKGELDHE
jgi:SH3-like domain-containing protein